MRFDLPESITAMRACRKTQTRRRSSYWLEKKPGDRITIVHKGEYLGHATVVRTWEHEEWHMTSAEAQAEGYPDLYRFWEAWGKLYPGQVTYPIIAIEFGNIKWRDGGEDARA